MDQVLQTTCFTSLCLEKQKPQKTPLATLLLCGLFGFGLAISNLVVNQLQRDLQCRVRCVLPVGHKRRVVLTGGHRRRGRLRFPSLPVKGHSGRGHRLLLALGRRRSGRVQQPCGLRHQALDVVIRGGLGQQRQKLAVNKANHDQVLRREELLLGIAAVLVGVFAIAGTFPASKRGPVALVEDLGHTAFMTHHAQRDVGGQSREGQKLLLWGLTQVDHALNVAGGANWLLEKRPAASLAQVLGGAVPDHVLAGPVGARDLLQLQKRVVVVARGVAVGTNRRGKQLRIAFLRVNNTAACGGHRNLERDHFACRGRVVAGDVVEVQHFKVLRNRNMTTVHHCFGTEHAKKKTKKTKKAPTAPPKDRSKKTIYGAPGCAVL